MKEKLYDFFEEKESDIVLRMKRERKNPGKMYRDYLTPRQLRTLKSKEHVGTLATHSQPTRAI